MENNTLAIRVLINIAVKVFFYQSKPKKGQRCLVEGLVIILNFFVVLLDLWISYSLNSH